MLHIASWNVNSINARLDNVLEWLKQTPNDVLLLQEIKCEQEKFPIMDFQMQGYNVAICGQKSYNGVAIVTKKTIEVVSTKLFEDDEDEPARYIEAKIDNKLRVISVYVPNGNPPYNDADNEEKFIYKLRWLDALYQRVQELMRLNIPFVIGGDFNVILSDEDVYDAKVFEGNALTRIEVKEKFRSLIHLGLVNSFKVLHPEGGNYSFWDYQGGAWQKDMGMLIDFILLSPKCADWLIDAGIDKELRGKTKASDHTPVWVKLDY
jgi:exodeoxyribonuclease-3